MKGSKPQNYALLIAALPHQHPRHSPKPHARTHARRYEKLQRWDEALRAYRKRLETTKPGSPENIEALLGECR